MIKNLSLAVIAHKEYGLLFNLLAFIMREQVEEVVVIVQSNPEDWAEDLNNPFGEIASIAAYCDVLVRDEHHGFMEPSLRLAHWHCTKEWMLQLDTDEKPTNQFLEALPALVENFNVSGYRLHRQNFIGGHRQINPDNPADLQLRLWRRGCLLELPENRIHRPVRLVPPIHNLEFPCIIHDKSREKYEANHARYKELIESGKAIDGRG